MKIAGGDINRIQSMSIQYTDVDDPATIRRVRGMLMPGYVIIERRDILKQEMEMALTVLMRFLIIRKSI